MRFNANKAAIAAALTLTIIGTTFVSPAEARRYKQKPQRQTIQQTYQSGSGQW